LSDEQVQATFFVVGRHLARFPAALETMRMRGHLIGNHTHSHPGLVDLLARGGDVVEELAMTNRLIRPYAAETVYFRPPYGSWRPEPAQDEPPQQCSAAAELLNQCGQFVDYLGPIMWDITGGDWGYWERNESVDACLARYLDEIEHAGRGIVLLHDSSEVRQFAERNQTYELTRRLVPELKCRGFRFVGLDRVPAIRRLQNAAMGVVA
jgi:peptidoglycan/xylan/chitin deacetylase (PgdA/CDA1 family)